MLGQCALHITPFVTSIYICIYDFVRSEPDRKMIRTVNKYTVLKPAPVFLKREQHMTHLIHILILHEVKETQSVTLRQPLSLHCSNSNVFCFTIVCQNNIQAQKKNTIFRRPLILWTFNSISSKCQTKMFLFAENKTAESGQNNRKDLKYCRKQVYFQSIQH